EGHIFSVAYQRLAGNAVELDKALTGLRKFADEHIDDKGYVWLVARGLFLNDRPDEAFALLERGKQFRRQFDILAFQSRYAEALALAPKAEDDKSLQLSQARLLYTLGQKDKARPIL